MKFVEVNFDGLVGPTHNYAGLAFGNVASISNAKITSHPKRAALQGLEKMRLLMQLGIPQAVLPPHPRPHIALLDNLGFRGSAGEIINKAAHDAKSAFAAAYSASSMWAANAATVSSASNTKDNKTHITPANLCSNLHRYQEAAVNYKIFKQIFKNEDYFTIHKPLPAVQFYADEGAANHSYICSDYNNEGIELFVYGRQGADNNNLAANSTKKYPARATLDAATSITRLHQVKDGHALFLQQAPNAIDQGAFHNDVVFVANKNVLFYHQLAFSETHTLKELVLEKLNKKVFFIEITEEELSLKEAVATYIFNSQIVSLPHRNEMAIIAPIEAEKSKVAKKVIDRILAADNPITKVYYVDCKESMQNGGGPACLRLRVIMPEIALKKLHGNVMLTEKLYNDLVIWVNNNYRDELTAEDLLDEKLYYESKEAQEELKTILKIDFS